MAKPISLAVLFLCCSFSLAAQQRQLKIYLLDASIEANDVVRVFYDVCPGADITLDQSEADYLLRISRPQDAYAAYTLYGHRGNVIESRAHLNLRRAAKSVCKTIGADRHKTKK